ncbi:MAG: 2-oxoglutarate dehydrogenase E1 component [Dokdonella sp.]|uniref:2-oxoglutarate dehydrogenase E1 component n=3 Tax=Dokdonella sp. TaxID=2291710 RepID=UPI002B881A40|nr:2-oxoglutarate dehydrogenase E1 component [Dokdonella sp.]HQW77189.1 2-oxoglutarate dehydrogenase E1 component [Dokdonella sp.]HQX65502.1 2-oxoglutarate dehydrogenase E1 component [Dokdonella sp.]HQZ62152.1 2-oxoglutarate dehydrogenase E1 component [Dokdonella sp.]
MTSSTLLQQFQSTSALSGGNAAFIEDLYEIWLQDPSGVSSEWNACFAALKGSPDRDVPHSAAIARIEAAQRQGVSRAAPVASAVDNVEAQKQAGVLKLVTAYRSRGHLAADLDPLDLANTFGKEELAALGLLPRPAAPDLELAFHGLSNADLDTEFNTGSLSGPQRLKLRDLLALLKATYASSIGVEFMHISDASQRQWMHEQLESTGGQFKLDKEEKKRLLGKLTQADGLERYLHTKYVGQKRFGLEGGDSLIPLLDEMLRRGGSAGLKDMVIGMAHRGRLNVLVNILGKPPSKLFDEFEGRFEHQEDPTRSGDVKYHMGFSANVRTPGSTVHVALAFNPSHLEIVDPVVAGSVRARQTHRNDVDREHVVPVLIHGDAAFAGQGVVMELFNMSQANGFCVGGTVHVVINNQVGFTISNPHDARSTLYCTDVAKMVNAPVFHVNGDDPQAVLFVARLAFDYRQKFKRDVVIDLVCYRRHGHNEADEPAATQPLMYQVIRKRPPLRELYSQKLIAEGVVSADEANAMVEDYRKLLEAGAPIPGVDADYHDAHAVDWSKHLANDIFEIVNTGVDAKQIAAVDAKLLNVPAGITLHPRVAKIYADREKMASGEQPMDWGFAENLAYATLIADGYNMRLVGQDAGRGTFFHRHAVMHDQRSGSHHVPLKTLRADASVEIIDSLLSEEAVMAFEYGYATAKPNTLVIWEAQFGDFANGAQVVIDQFISSGEAKWGRLCGIVLLLPHGYEGQGPEHSSARLERYLQLCAMENMQVCVPTTPAQMFHMLRRQMLRACRKPLVVMTPKSLLRHKLAVSTLDDLNNGHFHLVIPDATASNAKKVKRVVLCSGKVYYDLVEEAAKREIDNVAILRVEQLYPFPRAELTNELANYPAAGEIIWCQEEPMNQGAWYQIKHHLQAVSSSKQTVAYAGRARSPAPACGHLARHLAEQAELVEQALVSPINSDYALE